MTIGVVTDSYARDDESDTDGDEDEDEDDSDTDDKRGRGRQHSDNNFEGCYDHAVGDEVGDERYSSEDETKLSGIDGGGGGGDGRGRNRGSSR